MSRFEVSVECVPRGLQCAPVPSPHLAILAISAISAINDTNLRLYPYAATPRPRLETHRSLDSKETRSMTTLSVRSDVRGDGPAATFPRFLIALLAFLILTGASEAQTITGLSADEATVGTVFQVTGTGLGTSDTKVFFAEAGQKVKKTKLKVTVNTDTALTVQVQKAIRGTFTILVQLNNGSTDESADTIDIVPPAVVAVDTDVLQPNEEATASVEWPSSNTPKISMGGLTAELVSVSAPVGSPPTSTVTFKVPKKLPNGSWAVQFANSIGTVASSTGINVVGSSQSLGKAGVKAILEGAKPFKSKGAVGVTSSAEGPTIVMGRKKTNTWTITLPFVVGNDVAPQIYDAQSASVHYLDAKGNNEFMTDDDLTVIVSAQSNAGIVSGSFFGTLTPVTEGAADLLVSGTFVYDGSYGLGTTPGLTDNVLSDAEVAPPINVQILSLDGATGPTGAFQAGDSVAVTFRLAKDDGTAWKLEEMSLARSMISGPTSNYQRVVAQQTNVGSVAVDNGDGSYTYTFPPLPSTYLTPYNDTVSFGADDGELAGQSLLDGTYTLALLFEWSYTAGGASHDEFGGRTLDFLFGATPQLIVPREVVKTDNCNQCHTDLQAHGGMRRSSEVCVLCHTAGAEDRNTGGATPGVTIDWRIMIHKIHTGAHLPSVLGVTTDSGGTRNYAATPQPYQIVGYGNSVHDFSDVVFPAWPALVSPMPRDSGYDGILTDDEKALENLMRSGLTSCALCHGDPDGAGPLTAPAQGDLILSDPKRNTCGSCHEDWVPTNSYTSNGATMGPQLSDNACTFCHDPSGSSLAVQDAHVHPLLNPTFATGVVFDLLSVDEDGLGADMDGTVDAGEKVTVTFTIRDSLGADIDPADLNRHNVMISGPSENLNVLTPEMSIPAAMLTGGQPYTVNVPMRVYLEEAGTATAGADEFITEFAPHWNVTGALTTVFEVTGLTVGGGSSTLAANVVVPVNYIDVVDATNFARDDYLAIFTGGVPEYLLIQTVEGNRIWFSSPYTPGYQVGPRMDYSAGSAVVEVDLAPLVEGAGYTLTAATGTITEEVGAPWLDGNRIVAEYTTDFVMPATYGLALNAGPDLGETSGTWAGKSLVSGTYSLGMWGHIDRTLALVGETQSYRDGAMGQRIEFLVGSADELDPWDNIDSAASCYTCHVDIQFHGSNRRSFDACIMCHGTRGSGDRTQYVAPNAPATDGVTINFREMLHKIHRGADLENAATYEVVGFGSGYPDNYSVHTYEEVHFPSMASGVQNCAACHGTGSDSFFAPTPLEHPTEQILPVKEYTAVCGACHDDEVAQAHMELQATATIETCTLCHAPGQNWNVEIMHTVR